MTARLARRLARRALPARVHSQVVRRVQVHRLGTTGEDRRRLRRLLAAEPPAGEPVAVRLRPLAGTAFRLRPGTTDLEVVIDTFMARYHVPPGDALTADPGAVLDLGANIGATVADFAVRYPRARIVGAELDPANAALARANTAAWADRCEIVDAAVWPHAGRIAFESRGGDEWGAHVVESNVDREAWTDTVTVAELLDRLPDGHADLVKMDVEGAEARLLREATEWAPRVGCLMVEIHAPYTVAEALADLRALGFDARVDDRHWSAVIGRRTAAAASASSRQQP